jgi:hypothetical protein
MAMIPHLGSVSPKIEKIVDNTGLDAGVRLDKSAMSAPRGKRKSKVVDTILLTLKEGPTHSAELRSALASRGMSESSLSTGLSILQKSGQIKRDDDGAYYLSVREAA